MLKNRLLFTLLYADGFYNLSRNFNLQKVGDLSWLQDNYDFESIANSIDELVILDVSRGPRNPNLFSEQIKSLSKLCFMPLAAGGGIDSLNHAYKYFEAGADKIVLNSAFFSNPTLIHQLVRIYGSQSIVASIDFRILNSSRRIVYSENGAVATGLILEEAIRVVENLSPGEIYLTSINNDGTGNGYDLESLKLVASKCKIPVIASGGAGNYVHFVEALADGAVTAVSTANLFNFMCDGLCDARDLMLLKCIDLAKWIPSYSISVLNLDKNI